MQSIGFKERLFLSAVLVLVLGLILLDLVAGRPDAISGHHLVGELGGFLLGVAGLSVLWMRKSTWRLTTRRVRKDVANIERETARWRDQHKAVLQQFSNAIENEFNAWKLNASEKDVARLMIKGFDADEIARILGIAVVVAENEFESVLDKSNLADRTDLSNFFIPF